MVESEMSKYDGSTPPRGTIAINPGDFSDMENKPTEPVLAGLRFLSIRDRREIPKLVEQFTDEYEVARNESEMRLCVSFMLCDANDVSKPFRFFTRPQDQVFSHLTRAGARRIFDAYLKLEVETSAIYPEATPDDVEELYGLIEQGELDKLEGSERSTALRHLRFAYDVICGV